ncbi:MAG: sensor histidine kinase [Promethearchaeota archaeon]
MNYQEAYERANFYKNLFAHDMSNIIQSISLSLELCEKLKEEKDFFLSEKFRHLYSIIKSQIANAKLLISNINKLFSLENEPLELKPVNLHEYLNKVIKYIQKGFQEKELKIEIETIDNVNEVQANDLLFDVFMNILSNAIKYNENECIEILVKISNSDLNMVKIEIIDNGIGIPDVLKEKIFVQGYKELKGKKGMGIGLSLVAKIINYYGGKIWVENRIKRDHSRGSNFSILLPRASSSL